ncbi:unnamed protein product [Agarophyton chilense]
MTATKRALLRCEPDEQVVFRAAPGKTATQTLTLTNATGDEVVYKVKANAAARACLGVRNGCGYIAAYARAQVTVVRRASTQPQHTAARNAARQRVVIEAARTRDAPYATMGGFKVDARALWLQLSNDEVQRCVLGVVVVVVSGWYVPHELLVRMERVAGGMRVENVSAVNVALRVRESVGAPFVPTPDATVVAAGDTACVALRAGDGGEQGGLLYEQRQHAVRVQVTAATATNADTDADAEEVWGAVADGDVSSAVLSVGRDDGTEGWSVRDVVSDDELSATLVGRFAHALHDVVRITPDEIRAVAGGGDDEGGEETRWSAMRVRNVTTQAVVVRVRARNAGLWEMEPGEMVVGALGVGTVRVRVRHVRVATRWWSGLEDAARVEARVVGTATVVGGSVRLRMCRAL